MPFMFNETMPYRILRTPLALVITVESDYESNSPAATMSELRRPSHQVRDIVYAVIRNGSTSPLQHQLHR
jgi:hypothetical protein